MRKLEGFAKRVNALTVNVLGENRVKMLLNTRHYSLPDGEKHSLMVMRDLFGAINLT